MVVFLFRPAPLGKSDPIGVHFAPPRVFLPAKLGSSGRSQFGGALVEPSGLDLLLREFWYRPKVRHVIPVNREGILWSPCVD